MRNTARDNTSSLITFDPLIRFIESLLLALENELRTLGILISTTDGNSKFIFFLFTDSQYRHFMRITGFIILFSYV